MNEANEVKGMNDVMKGFGNFLLDVLKQLDWKTVVYKSFMNTVLPMLEKMSADSASKIDDIIVAGLRQLIIKFLGPQEAQHLLLKESDIKNIQGGLMSEDKKDPKVKEQESKNPGGAEPKEKVQPELNPKEKEANKSVELPNKHKV